MASSFRKKKTQPYASLSIDPTTLVSSDALPPPTTIVVTGRDDGNTAKTTIQGLHSMRTSPLSDTNTTSAAVFSAPDTPSSAVLGGGVFQPLPLTIQVRGTDVSDHNGTPRSVIPHRVGSLGGGLDMSLAMSPDAVKMTLKQNIRACIFRYVKFWDRDEHGKESLRRSVIKTMSYRLITFIISIILSKLILSDSNQTAAAFAVSQFVVLLVLYYIVERVFNRFNIGRVAVNGG